MRGSTWIAVIGAMAALCVAWGGCGDDDGAADAAVSMDGGTTGDAGSPPDGGDEDGGDSVDAGARVDGGMAPSGRIVPDPDNPAWLRYEGGEPFFLCGPGDPEGFLYRGTRNADGTRDGDQSELVAKVAGTGANGIYFQVIRSHGGDGEADHNPFVGSDPAMGLDEDILDQWEGWLDEMEAAGIVAYMFLYDDSARLWDTGDTVGSEEEAFIHALVDRFEHHDRLIWVIAEEYEERYSAARVSAIAATLRAADDRDHVIAVHKLHGLAFDELADDPNLDQYSIQYNVPTAAELHDGMVTAFADAAGRYNLAMTEAADHGTGRVARVKSWSTALGGAYVMVIGQDIASTDRADLEDCGRLVRFMEATTLSALAPHDELALGATQYVLADPGAAYVAYAADAAADLGLRGLDPGSYELRWLDPADGDERVETVEVTEADHVFATPADIGPEVALYARRAP